MNRSDKAFDVIVSLTAVAAIIGGMVSSVCFDGWLKIVGIILVCVGVCALLWGVVRSVKSKALTTAKYARKKSMVTSSELEFLSVLRRIAPTKYEVLPQVALLSVIDKRTETSYRNELFRIIDFVFVDRETFAPLLLVELNDSSHMRADRKLRDEKVGEICRKAKLPLVTFTMREARDLALVKKTVLSNVLKR